MIDQGFSQFGHHQVRCSRFVEQVFEEGEELVASQWFEIEASADTASQGQQVAPSESVRQATIAAKHDGEETLGVEMDAPEQT